jgi:hypothetical protein
MQQAKFSLPADQIEFLNQYEAWGFRDKSALVREAIERLKAELARGRRAESARLYAEIYAEDQELQGLIDSAIEDWPRE